MTSFTDIALGHTLIIGGSSGMGLGLARRLLAAGAEVTIAGRNPQRLRRAAADLGEPEPLHTRPVDIAEEASVAALVGGCAGLTHVVVTAVDASVAYGPLAEFDAAAARGVLGTKILGPWLVAKHAARVLPPSGSVTIASGVASERPSPGGSLIATANAAITGLVRALAVELAPIRVNAVSPGWVDTPLWDDLAGADRQRRLAAKAAVLPVGRVGTPDDIASAFLAMMTNGYLTGSVLEIDGGHRFV
jgi:NAD(P)-dependent dehydrogenase (short-subunit alcohol dehydrogenase family)